MVRRVSGLLSREDALALVLERVVPLDGEEVAVQDAAGRVLAKAAYSTVDLPGFDASAMDGFAVQTRDVPGRLRLSGRIPAGRPSPHALAPGETFAISTGAEVPEAADAVVPVEDAVAEGTHVDIPLSVAPGSNVRPRGGDLAAGALVVGAGIRLGAAHLGALAAAGLTTVVCYRRPSVVVAVTGNELRSPGEQLGPGEIYDANGLILATQVRSAGAEPTRLAVVRDEPDATEAAVEHGLSHDVLVTSGGVSVGAFDFVRAAEARLGVEEVFWRVAVRPGKPIAFGVRGNTLVFGLPGNPVSSLVGFELFVRPALLALQGLADPAPAFRPGLLARPARMISERESLLRATARVADNSVLLEPLTGQDSHMIARAATADALVLVPSGEGELPAGSAVFYLAL